MVHSSRNVDNTSPWLLLGQKRTVIWLKFLSVTVLSRIQRFGTVTVILIENFCFWCRQHVLQTDTSSVPISTFEQYPFLFNNFSSLICYRLRVSLLWRDLEFLVFLFRRIELAPNVEVAHSDTLTLFCYFMEQCIHGVPKHFYGPRIFAALKIH